MSHKIMKPYLHNRPNNKANLGISLTELLVSSVVASIVISATMGGAMFSRQLYTQDGARTQVNQTLRSSMDMVGADVQQAGESMRRVDPTFPIIQLQQDPNNTGSSILTMRRNELLPIPVCANLGNFSTDPPTAGGSIQNITIFTRDPDRTDDIVPPGNCAELEDETDSNSAPMVDDILNRLEAQRVEQGGTLRLYLYDGDGGGQFVDISTSINNNPLNANDDIRYLSINATTGQKPYAAGAARLYVLTERRYQLNNGSLQLTINNGQPQTIVSGIQRFQVLARSNGATAGAALIERTSFCHLIATPTPCVDTSAPAALQNHAWSEINHLQVTMLATNAVDAGSLITGKETQASRTLVEQFFPRNVMSF